MKTPYLYNKNIKNKILTDQMLAECIYSVNKRAKNFRDKAQEYRYANRSRRGWNFYYYDKFDNEGQARDKIFLVNGKTKHMKALKPDEEPEVKVDKATLPVTSAQIQYIKAICDALNLDMPQDLNLKSAHSWLNKIKKEYPDIKDILRKHKGKLRKKETKARN